MFNHSRIRVHTVIFSAALGALLFLLCIPGALAQGSPAEVGQWSSVLPMGYESVHSILLPNGKVLYWSVRAESLHPQIWDPSTNSVTPAALPGYELFCAGHSYLPNGHILVTGGNIADNVGLPNASIYNPFNNTWNPVTDMNAGRWYPTNTTLANGDVLVIAGDITSRQDTNTLPQVWQTASGTWRNLTTAQRALPTYPMMFLTPAGEVVYVAPDITSHILDPAGTGSWSVLGNANWGYRDYGTGVMYDTGKILMTGGGSPPTNTAEILDLNAQNPAWQYTGSMSFARRQANATVLPDGNVFISGGSSGLGNDNAQFPVYATEMWNPSTGTFTLMAPISVYRGYHSTAVLLLDGRILSSGGDIGGANGEIYSPPYLFKGARPTLASAPSTAAWGQDFFVETPDNASIAQVSLIRITAVTHSFNQDQRFMRLTFSQASGGLDITAPADGNIAPPGPYMLFLLNSEGVPSIGKVIYLGAAQDQNQPPVSIITASPTEAGAPVTVTFNGSGSTDSDGFIAAYTWDFGDGQSSTSINPQHTYTVPGDYLARLTVTDSGGLTGTSTVTIAVTTAIPSAPTLASVFPASAQQGQAASVILTGTNFVAGTICSFGAGITVNSCTYNSPTQMTANLFLAVAAAVGPRNIIVTNPDTQSGMLPAGFAVTVVTSTIIHKDFAYPDRSALLADGWSFLAQTAGGATRDTEQSGAAGVDYDQAVHPGTLRIPVGSGDVYQSTATSENTLFLDLPADWTSIRLKIAAFDPVAEYQRVALMAYQDDDNYVVVDRIKNGLPFVEFYGEQAAVVPSATFTQLINTGNLILRLDRDTEPDTWKGYFSTDGGATWVPTGTLVQALNTPRLGINVGANFAAIIPNADLAWVEIIRPSSPAPVVTSVSPASAAQGDALLAVITGANFAAGATCNFGGGITVTNCALNSSTSINASISLSPTEAPPGPHTVTVTNPDGHSGSLINGFTVTLPHPPPTLDDASPSAAAQGQSLDVVLIGSNFASGATCAFGSGITVNSCVFNSAIQLTASISIATSAVPGAHDITVTNVDTRSATLSGGFTVNLVIFPPPSLTSVSPASAEQGQAANVALSGANFVTGTACSFGPDVTLNSCTYNSPTQMTANLSVAVAAAVGPRNVTVTNPDTQSAMLPGAFAVSIATNIVTQKDFTYPDRSALLADGWSFLAQTAGGATRDTEQSGAAGVDYDQTAHPGTLRIPVGSGDLYQSTATSENSLFLDLPSDWTSIRLKIAAFDPVAEYQRVALLAYQDDDNYVVVDRIMNGLPFVEFYREQDALATGTTFTQLINSGNLILRLDKDTEPDTWKGFFSTDAGATWVPIGTQIQALNTPRLGINIGANFAPTIPNADLAWVEIIRPLPPPLPMITSVSPDSAAQGQSLVVVVTGENFAPGATCDFGPGIAVSSCSYDSSTSMSVSISLSLTDTLGPHTVTVTNPDGASVSLVNGFTVIEPPPPPFLTSFTPTSGPVGTLVALTGSGFTGTIAVEFNGTPATTFTVDSDSQITATAPPGATTGPISVTNPAGTAFSSTNFMIDIMAPETTITAAPPALTNGTEASFEFTASEAGSTFQCNLDGAAFAPCISPQNYTGLPEDSHSFAVRASDTAGNTDETPATHDWTVDITPPATTITGAPPALTNGTEATFEFTASDTGSTFQCSLDGAAFAVCISPQDYTGLFEGGHSFEVRATDPAGNTEATARHNWMIDITPPETTITAAPPALGNSTEASFEFTASETGSAFQCSLDGAAFAPCISPQQYASLLEGSHQFQGKAVDALGNFDATPATHDWTITPPETPAPPPTLTSVSPPSAEQWQNAQVVLIGSGFRVGATCSLGSGVTVNSCAYDSPTQMTANMSVDMAAVPGPRDVAVTNPDTQYAMLPGAFSISANTLTHKDFIYPNREALLADSWSFLAKTAGGATRDTEQSGAAGLDYNQVAHPGTIRVPVGPGDVYQTTATSENTLFLDLPPDWTSIRLKIAAFDPMADYQRVALMAYQDDDNYVVVDRIHNGQPFVEFYREQAAVVPPSITFTPLTNFADLILRLDKDLTPDTWKGFFSTDYGATWVPIGTQLQVLNSPRLGIHVGANFAPDIINADLAWVEIIRSPISVTVSPKTVTMFTNRTKQFTATVVGTANNAVTWSTDGGSISTSGLFTSPPTPGTFTVTATSQADPTKFASATVTVNPTSFVIYSNPTSVTFNDPLGTGITSKQVMVNDTTPFYPLPLPSIVTDQPWLTVSPSSGTTLPNSAFKITVGVLLDGLGIGTYSGNVIITGGVEPNGDTVINSPFSIPVTLIMPPVSVTISPATTSMFTNRTKQFTKTVKGTANKAVTWSADGGTISDSGLFTSPPTPGTFTVTATSQADPTKFASATVTVNPTNFVIYSNPTSVSFSAPLGVPIASKQVIVNDTTPFYPLPLPSIVTDQPWLTVSPSSGTTLPNSAFEITVGVLLDGLGVGTYSGNIIITGGIEPNGDTVINSPFSIPVALTITPPPPVSVTVSPTTATLLTGQTRQFTATVSGTTNTAVTWSTAGGTVSASGLFTAPVTAGTYTVTATSQADTTKSASATVTVNNALPPGCIQSSGSTWQRSAFAAQTGRFTASYEATPNGNRIDAVLGLSTNPATRYDHLAVITRFYTNGLIDARNGGAYAAVNPIPYVAGVTYRFRVVVDMATKRYDAYVAPLGGAEVQIAANYQFRSEQSSASSLGYWNTFSASGNQTVCNFALF